MKHLIRYFLSLVLCCYPLAAEILFWDGAEQFYNNGSQQSQDNYGEKWRKIGGTSAGLNPSSNAGSGSTCGNRPNALGTRVISSDALGVVQYISVANLATLFVEVWECAQFDNNTNDLITIQESSNVQLTVRRVAGGGGTYTLRVLDANTSQVGSDFSVAVDTWTHIGIKLTVGNSGFLTVRFNETVNINNVGGDFQAGANAYATLVNLTGLSGSSYVADDFIIQDSAGSFLGKKANCVAIFPSAAGDSTQWTPSAGANWENVDETIPDQDTTYNSIGSTGQLDLYNVGNLPATASTVLGVDVWARMRETAGTGEVKLATKTGGTTYYGSTESLTTAYAPYRKQYLLNPNTSAAWTRSQVDAVQLGEESVTTTGGDVRVTSISAEVLVLTSASVPVINNPIVF